MKRKLVVMASIFLVSVSLGGIITINALQQATFPSVNQRPFFFAQLNGYDEVPAVSTTGTGSFRATLSEDGVTIDYRLSYSGLTAPAFAAHIHLGQFGVNGGVIVFLCGGGDKPMCPGTGGTVTGTIDAADVIGPASQGIAAGEFSELLAALRIGATYVNAHNSNFPGGEIRGQIQPELSGVL